MTTSPPQLRERPIIFSAPMVRAILDGKKTQTRRVMKLQPGQGDSSYLDVTGPLYRGCVVARWPGEGEFDGFECHCPYGASGDRLWVKEKFILGYPADAEGKRFSAIPPTGGRPGATTFYAADRVEHPDRPQIPWRSPRFMPRWASRLTLDITNIGVHRIQEIDQFDARAEGAPGPNRVGYFARLWDEINGKRPGCRWADNPWVWALKFRRVTHGGDR